MTSGTSEHVVLTHVEVIGDVDAFESAWLKWIAAHLEGASGLIEARVHRETTGRRLVLIQRWKRASDYGSWSPSEAARSIEPLFDAHAVRSATSRWDARGEPA